MELCTEQLEPVLDVEEVIALEKRIEQSGIPLAELMDRAGAALVECLYDCAPASARHVCVLAGSGNNGGDGWVAARLLASKGAQVTIVTRRNASEISAHPAYEAARATMMAIEDDGLPILVYENPGEEKLDEVLQHADAVIDCILGTGFEGENVREPYDMWIRLANTARTRGSWIFACDTPSGLSAQSGRAAQPTIEADRTVTMLAIKPGLIAKGSGQFTGKLLLAPLGVEHS